MRHQKQRLFVCVSAALACLAACAGAGTLRADTNRVPAEVARGAMVARSVCATCHVFPEPGLLDQAAWGLEVLPKMRQMMGFEPINYDRMPGGKLVEAQRPYPTAPLVEEDDWMAVVRYYLASAPVRLPARETKPLDVRPDFQAVVVPTFKDADTAITAVKIDAKERRVYVADAGSKALYVLDAQGKTLAAMGLEKPAVHLQPTGDGLYITIIGRLYPSDEPEGQVMFIGKPDAGGAKVQVLLDKLHRPVHTLVTDLNGDGREDLAVSAYGNILGRFSWYERQENGGFKEHVLIDRPGAIASEAVDLDKDGRKDLIVLMAQAWEGVYWLRNTGNGFEPKPLIQWPPSWGSTSFQLVDFNGDGHLDLLASNGDNGDYGNMPAPLKPYHGIRVYLNDGQQAFKEHYFHPMNGVYRAIAGDFRKTGRLDVAAIAFFPDFASRPWDSMVYLENTGPTLWRAADLPDSRRGRWFVMDAGDIDGDGRLDLAAGSFLKGPGRVLKLDAEGWRERPAPVQWWLGRPQKEVK